MAPAAITSVKSAIGHFRRKSKASSTSEYDPPAGPPPTKNKNVSNDTTPSSGIPLHQPYVHEVTLPLVHPHRAYNLAAQGWTTLSLSPLSPTTTTTTHQTTAADAARAKQLRDATSTLFAASAAFFACDDAYKQQFISPNHMGSEEGYNSIPGEKQFYTIRSTQLLPAELVTAASAFWAVAGDLLHDMLARIAESVAFPSTESLTQLSEGCRRLTNERSATMLRVFRYEGWEDKVVAEPHADLGLLSLVCGQAPGLEVFNSLTQTYYPVEQRAAAVSAEHGGDGLSGMATVLVGRQLQRLTNGVYTPGGHLVRSYPATELVSSSNGVGTGVDEDGPAPTATLPKRYRYSIVFVLRGHYPVVLDKKSFTSPITGEPAMIEDGMTAKELFVKIKGIHYNINTGFTARDEQKKRLAAKRNDTQNGSSGIA